MAFTLQPSITNNVFVPDQLIGGSADIITDSITVASGLTLARGTLMGKQTASLYSTSSSASTTSGGTNTGNATIGSITVGPFVVLGTYRVNMTGATAFNVVAPNGSLVGTGSNGTAFASAQINLTVTTGGIGMAAGDGFSIVVAAAAGAGNGYWVAATAAATDGSQEPRNWAVLAQDINTSSSGTNAATATAAYVAGEFDANAMIFGTGLTAAGCKEALRQSGGRIQIKTGALVNAIV